MLIFINKLYIYIYKIILLNKYINICNLIFKTFIYVMLNSLKRIKINIVTSFSQFEFYHVICIFNVYLIAFLSIHPKLGLVEL